MASTTETKETAKVEHIGDYVTDVELSIWMRPRKLTVTVHGLRPNTRFYPYFDGIDVSAHCAPADYDTTKAVQVSNETGRPLTSNASDAPDADILSKATHQTGVKGDELRSDSKGDLRYFFYIPEKTFKIGDRKMEVMDAYPYTSSDSATSYAAKRYSSYSLSYTKEAAEVTTRTIENTKTITNETKAPTYKKSKISIKASNSRDDGGTNFSVYEDSDGTRTVVNRDGKGNVVDVTQTTANGSKSQVSVTDRNAVADSAEDTNVGNSGSCYLTTAIVEKRGEADNGYTLTTLRRFRDTYLANKHNEVVYYYNIAPKIVVAIPEDHSDWIWIGTQVDKAIEQIERNDLEAAYQTYKNMTLKLEEEWLGH